MKIISKLFSKDQHGKKTSLHVNRGFSLVELLVVVSIFIIITGLVLIRQTRFSSDIAITNLAYQVGLSIRESQVYGLSVRSTEANCATCFDAGYGVHFESGSKTSYVFFGDVDSNFMYDGASSKDPVDKAIKNNILGRETNIKDACIIAGADRHCFVPDEGGKNPPTPISTLDIVFKRPSPDAIITGGTDADPITGATRAIITVASAGGDRIKCINIYETGQISVGDTVGGKCE